MFSGFFRVITEWWDEKEKENWFVYNTLSELHQKLRVFDRQADFWTYRGLSYVTICRGEKFLLYQYGKTTCLCTVTLEKKLGQWFLITEYAYGLTGKQHYPVTYLDMVVADIRKHYDV